MNALDLVRTARRRLGKVPVLRRLYAEADLIWKYKEWRPERLVLSGSKHAIHVNPREPRGRAILSCFGGGQPGLKRIWRRALEQNDPTIVLDVGANYGEFVFLTDYPEKAIVLAIEADPALHRYLERSKAERTDRHRIELACALASEQPGDPIPFYVDAEWSGRSSALKQDRHGTNAKVEMIKQTSVDALLEGRVGTGDRLVFKIDVEGYEPKVLAGMEKTLSTVARAVGILEFNQAFLQKLGVEPQAYLDKLRQRFTVWLLDEKDQPIDLTGKSLHDVRDVRGGGDIVVSTDPAALPPLFR